MAEPRKNLIKGLDNDLKHALTKGVVKIQCQAHKDLQNLLSNTIRQMGFEFDYKERNDVQDKIMAHITFSLPLFK